MADKSYKHFYDDGYTTYHDDGSKSVSYKNIFSDGYTTYHYPSTKNNYHQTSISQNSDTHNYGGFTPIPKNHRLSTGSIVFAYVILLSITILSFLYSGSIVVLPYIIFAAVMAVNINKVKNGDEKKQEIWAQIINLVMTIAFMIVVDHITAAPKNLLLAILFYLLPLGIIILSVCLNNTINDDEEFMFGYVFFMIVTWFFRIIYKKNFPQLYGGFLLIASIVLAVWFIAVLLFTIHSQKKKAV